MNAESLEFNENKFDIIFGASILHHLDLSKVLPELARVLNSEGKAVFIEPLGHNPFINLYRKFTPNFRTEDEHPLKIKEIHSLKKNFKKLEINYFHFTTLFAVPIRNSVFFTPLLNAFGKIDKFLFSLPFLRKYAWQVVLILSDPEKV